MEKNKALPFVIEKSEADSSHVIANRKWGQSLFFKMKIPHMSLRGAQRRGTKMGTVPLLSGC